MVSIDSFNQFNLIDDHFFFAPYSLDICGDKIKFSSSSFNPKQQQQQQLNTSSVTDFPGMFFFDFFFDKFFFKLINFF